MSHSMKYAQQIAYSSFDVLMFTYETAGKYKDSPGCYVECGVAAGAQVIALIAGSGRKKMVWAFDSFCGIPLPSNRDDQLPGIRTLEPWERIALPNPGEQLLESSGATVVSLDNFWTNIRHAFPEGPIPLTSVEGWFEKTMLDLPIGLGDISILRLDGDLYNSTFVCLQALFPKVLKHGIVIIDDWTLPGCQSACMEYFALIGYEPEFQFISTTAYFYK